MWPRNDGEGAMERYVGLGCVVEADVDLRREPSGIDRTRGRG